MQTIKVIKDSEVLILTNEIGGISYTTKWRPYELGNIPKNFGCIEFINDQEGIDNWINYKGLTYIQE